LFNPWSGNELAVDVPSHIRNLQPAEADHRDLFGATDILMNA
jgi:hypothetical protein